MSRYSELLRDPRWQKKRLEIMSRDGFACRECKDTSATLHVHHCYYERGRQPWEYEDSSLVTLCEACHAGEGSTLREKIALCNALSRHGARAKHFWMLTSYVEDATPECLEVMVCAVCQALDDPRRQRELFDLMAAKFGVARGAA